MVYIGRIISQSKTIQTFDFVQVTDKSSLIDPSVPTLIVGKKKAESLYGTDKVRILDKKICDNVWWTYAKTERRDEFEEGIEAFNEHMVGVLRKSINVQYRNPMTMGYTMAKRLISYFNGGRLRYVYLKGWHLYVCDGNVVMSMSLRDTEFIGIPWKKVLDIVYKNRCSIRVENVDFLNYRTRKVVDEYPASIPYLFSLSMY